LALGLAFGIGGRDTAAELAREWYARAAGPHPKSKRRQKTFGATCGQDQSVTTKPEGVGAL
jgi:hypothetical protein